MAMTCPYCGESIKPNEGYPQWKLRYHTTCWENKIRRETRADFDKSTMVQKYVKERDKIKKK